jgi:hypothetical protein
MRAYYMKEYKKEILWIINWFKEHCGDAIVVFGKGANDKS